MEVRTFLSPGYLDRSHRLSYECGADELRLQALAGIGCRDGLARGQGDGLRLLCAAVVLIAFWAPMLIVQFKAFAQCLTPYPYRAKWFNLFVGAVPALLASALIGPRTALGAGIGTMFLSFGNAWTFGGLLATLPGQECFDQFQCRIGKA